MHAVLARISKKRALRWLFTAAQNALNNDYLRIRRISVDNTRQMRATPDLRAASATAFATATETFLSSALGIM